MKNHRKEVRCKMEQQQQSAKTIARELLDLLSEEVFPVTRAEQETLSLMQAHVEQELGEEWSNLRILSYRVQDGVHYVEMYRGGEEEEGSDGVYVELVIGENVSGENLEPWMFFVSSTHEVEESMDPQEIGVTVQLPPDAELFDENGNLNVSAVLGESVLREIWDEDSLSEAAPHKVVRVIGGKKVVKKVCPPGYKFNGTTCVRMSPQELRARRLAARRAWRKKRGKMSQILRKRALSLKRRKAMGL